MHRLTRASAAFALVAACASLGGCAWLSSWWPWGRKPAAPVSVAPTVMADPSHGLTTEPAAAARAACRNYEKAVQDAPFPREAIIRGIDQGSASVQFAVDGTTVTVLSVRSSDPAFGNAAADIVGTLDCRVDRPTRFEVPFSWRTVR